METYAMGLTDKKGLTDKQCNVAPTCATVSAKSTVTRDFKIPDNNPLLILLQRNPETALLRLIGQARQQGWLALAKTLGLTETTLRQAMLEAVNGLCSAGVGWGLAWSEEPTVISSEYRVPPIVNRLSDLLQLFAMEVGVYLEFSHAHFDIECKRVTSITELYLAQAEKDLAVAVKQTHDTHQLVHIEEVATTYASTLLQILVAIQDYPAKLETETRPDLQVFEVHGHLSGLLDSPYLFNEEDSARVVPGTAGYGGPSRRLTLDTDRRGKDVSFEELANIYRTSRVTISNTLQRMLILMRKDFKQLRLSGADCAAIFAK